MSAFCFVKVISMKLPVPKLERLRELIPLVQFVVLSYIWSLTSFYRDYPLLMCISWSILFYLVNGKLVLSCVTHVPMKMLHLELLYMLAPAAVLLAEKMAWLSAARCDTLQIWIGIILTLLNCERCITYSALVVTQMTAFLGFGFFEMPKGKKDEVKSNVREMSQPDDSKVKKTTTT